MGGFAPHIFEGLPGPPGPARPQKRTQTQIRPDCLQVPSSRFLHDVGTSLVRVLSPENFEAQVGVYRNADETVAFAGERCRTSRIGDLWMWLQLMWLQFEVVRGPVGVVWGRFGAGAIWAPSRFQNDTKRPQPDLGPRQIAAT